MSPKVGVILIMIQNYGPQKLSWYNTNVNVKINSRSKNNLHEVNDIKM